VLNVREAVQRRLVPALGELARQAGLRLDLLADEEEGGRRPRRLERVEHRRRRVAVGAVVEGQRDPVLAALEPFAPGQPPPALDRVDELAIARHYVAASWGPPKAPLRP
jgi:hypothetical protein